jgi:hypothetical protein
VLSGTRTASENSYMRACATSPEELPQNPTIPIPRCSPPKIPFVYVAAKPTARMHDILHVSSSVGSLRCSFENQGWRLI